MPFTLTHFKTERKQDPSDKNKCHLKIHYLDEFGGLHVKSETERREDAPSESATQPESPAPKVTPKAPKV